MRKVKNNGNAALRIIGRTLASIGSLLLAVILLLYGAMAIICYGPSYSTRDLFVNTVMETSAAKFLAHMYLSNDTIDSIIKGNTAADFDAVTDTGAIDFGDKEADFDINAITVEDVKGNTFVGKMMIVNDPSRVYVKTLNKFSTTGLGKYLTDLISEDGAVAGINGGGFSDPNGYGGGAMPIGAVIHNGQLLSNAGGPHDTMVGFTNEHKLLIGKMSGSEALERGVTEAVAFGPALIISGERVPITGTGGGLNPRTAIGQRADGAVLLLVIDGRQPHSLGATYKDVADVMENYGAVNAGNLDGGSSTMMVYNGEIQNSMSIIGTRLIPTAFVVSPPKAEVSADEQ